MSPAKYLCCVYYAAEKLHDKGKVSRFWLTFLYIVSFLRFCSYFREDLTSRSSVSTISEPSSGFAMCISMPAAKAS